MLRAANQTVHLIVQDLGPGAGDPLARIEMAAHRPPDTLGAEQALVRDWPDYSKPMNRLELARRLDRAAVRRAAAVEPELNTLLKCIGL